MLSIQQMKSSMLAIRTIQSSSLSSSSSSLSTGVRRSAAGQRNQFHGLTNKAAYHRGFRRQQQTCTRRRRFATTAEEVVEEPGYNVLKIIAIGQAIPFIGFGFMDNAILIVAGDAIDT
ncbi:MAG: hypothetical protein SGBAC_012961 [Bacillariaceae sp.]